MTSNKFFILFFFLVFLVACTPSIPQESSKDFCSYDSECVCGGIDKNTNDCFVGNKDYAAKNVDMSRDCPDFCTGIANMFETKCVNNKCQNVRKEQEFVACTADAKICPDGSGVGRIPPNCEFAPCPDIPPEISARFCGNETMSCPDGSSVMKVGPDCEFAPCGGIIGESEPADLSSAHWLCEDGSWKETPEGCFENSCLTKQDCQLMGVTGICGPYMIAGPSATLHKPPVFYSDRCGAEQCSIMNAMCVDPKDAPRILGTDCVENKCVVRTEEQG